jgi:predicted HTH transcriptional regulator
MSGRQIQTLIEQGEDQSVEFIREHGSIAFGEFRKLCSGAAERTLRKDLMDLVTLKLVKPVGEKRGRKYLLR